MKKLSTVLLSGILLTSSVVVSAYADSNPYEGNLTGDWGGMRSTLSDKGVDFEAAYAVDSINNLSGGLKRNGEVLDNLDVTMTIDGKKLYNIEGSTIFIYLLNNNGGKPNTDNVGSVQGVDNIEITARTTKLYEAWIEQNFVEDKISIRAGLYDLNSEFYATDSSSLFLNPTYGIGTDFAQSGTAGPSIFPTTSFGLRTKWQPSEKSYIQFVALDGVSGDPHNPQGTHIQFNDRDGLLMAAEASHNFDYARLAIGGWGYTERFDDLTEVDSAGAAVKKRNKGIYAMTEKNITKNATAFARLGFANKDINRTDYSWAVGATINEIIPSRKDSQLGVAATSSHNSTKYKRSQAAAGTPADSSEIGFELTYSDQLLPWLRVQPDLQYTVNPGTNQLRDNSWVAGVRFEVNF